MGYEFDGRALGQVLVETERLAEQARDQEHRMVRLVQQLDAAADPACRDLLLEIRHLCVNTRDQRLQLESMLTRLIGTPPHGQATDPSLPAVLVADDSLEHREAAARTLAAAGFGAVTAANGLDALMAAHYVRPVVAVIGVSMPVLDGIEAARLLKSSPSTRHIRVIAYTAWPSFYDGPLKSVFDGVLAKPSTAEALVAFVRRFVGEDPPPEAGESPSTGAP